MTLARLGHGRRWNDLVQMREAVMEAPRCVGHAHRGQGHVTVPQSPAHCCSMHVIAASTIGHVMRLVQDMQQVSAQPCWRPSGVHIESTQTSDGTQKAIIWHD